MRDTSIRKASIDSGFSDQFAYKGQLVHYSGDKILYINGGTITDGPFTTTFQDSIITSGTAKGWVRRVESITDPVEGAVIKITYDDATLGGTAFSGNETDIAQDHLQRGLGVPYLTSNTAAGVDANFWISSGLNFGIQLIGNAGTGYVVGETFTVPGTAFPGGVSPANDATITINTVTGTGQILTASITGTTGNVTRPVGEGVGIAPMLEKANGRVSSSSQLEFTVNPAADYLDVQYMIKDNTIINADVKSDAGIEQSKLSLQAADTSAAAPGSFDQSLLGLAKFDSGDFDVTHGWVTLKAGSVDLADIEEISSLTALGNISNASAVPAEVPITATGGNDSLVLTKSDGKIRTTGLIVGTDDSYTILQPKSGAATTIEMLTPGGAQIFEATGTSAITAEFAASIDIGASGANTQSTLQSNSTFSGASRLSSAWIKSNFVEATNDAGTGIAIGTGTGKTASGELGMVTGGVVPFKFSNTGVIPDVNNTYNIGSGTAKYNTVYATTFDGIATKARYADLAENYSADTEYEPGTVIILGGAKEITTTTTKGDTKVIGVVSEKPAYLMNSDLTGEFVTPVALTGRVPCKVIGKTQPGDILVSSAIAGYAIVNNNPEVGTVIGKAMETKDTTERGTIEIVVGKV